MRMYYALISGPTKDEFVKVIEHNKQASKAICDYVKNKGFEKFFINHGLSGIYIPHGETQPEGWRVPNRNRMSAPKKRCKDYEEFYALPKVIEGFSLQNHKVIKNFCGQTGLTLHFPLFKLTDDNIVLVSFEASDVPEFSENDIVVEKTGSEIKKLWDGE